MVSGKTKKPFSLKCPLEAFRKRYHHSVAWHAAHGECPQVRDYVFLEWDNLIQPDLSAGSENLSEPPPCLQLS